MKSNERLINFDDIRQKQDFLVKAGSLRGVHLVSFSPFRKPKSPESLRYYFGFIVSPFADHLTREWMRPVDNTEAHKYLKDRGHIDSTKKMDEEEFWIYVEVIAHFLAELGIIVPDPSLFGLKYEFRRPPTYIPRE